MTMLITLVLNRVRVRVRSEEWGEGVSWVSWLVSDHLMFVCGDVGDALALLFCVAVMHFDTHLWTYEITSVCDNAFWYTHVHTHPQAKKNEALPRPFLPFLHTITLNPFVLVLVLPRFFFALSPSPTTPFLSPGSRFTAHCALAWRSFLKPLRILSIGSSGCTCAFPASTMLRRMHIYTIGIVIINITLLAHRIVVIPSMKCHVNPFCTHLLLCNACGKYFSCLQSNYCSHW